jgi:hypothetical protein
MENDINLMIEKMKLIGDKFAKLALDSESIKISARAFHIAERAYAFCLKYYNKDKVVDHLPMFLEKITGKVNRAELYRAYVQFAIQLGVEPLSKGTFFNVMQRYGFGVRKIEGSYIVQPPRGGFKPKLISAAAREELARMEILDISVESPEFSLPGNEDDAIASTVEGFNEAKNDD